ncbi:hypothetical protein [Polymorphospora lycopeni]|uniref:Uncharacterized protein n=2 Tax=Polymorphospora TaxID=338583 RepID=A0ABV5CIM2_9ACTN
MSILHTSQRRVGWLGRAAAVTCAAVMTVGLGATHAVAKPATPPASAADVTEMVNALFVDASDAMRYSIAVAAADPDRSWPAGSIEAQLADAFQDMPAQRRQAYTDGAKAMLTKADTQFGRYGKVAPAEYAGRGFADVYARSPLPVDPARFGSALKARHDAEAALRAPGGAQDARCQDCPDPEPDPCRDLGICEPPPAPKPKTGLKFMINKVVCVDETGSGVGEWGSDEIALGGLVVTPGGDTLQVGAYEIPQGFDDGTIWTFYNNGFTFGSFDLPTTYPGVYTASVLLTEVDAGGFASVLNTVWQQVKGTVQTEVARRVGQVLEPVLRSKLIAQALGALAGYFAVELVNWIINSFNDDVFMQAGSSQFTLNTINDALPSGVFRFSDHDGVYDVHYSWTWRR